MEDLSIIENNLKELFVDYIDEMFKNMNENKNYDINFLDYKKKQMIRYFDKTDSIMKNMIKNIDNSNINNVEKVVLKI